MPFVTAVSQPDQGTEIAAPPTPTAPRPARQGEEKRDPASAAGPTAAAPQTPGIAAMPGDIGSDQVAVAGPGDVLPVSAAPPGPSAATPQSAPTAPAAPVTPAALGPVLVALAADPGRGMVEITLSPEDLGTLQVQVHDDAAGLRILVLAERADTSDLLRRHGEVLRTELAAAGLGHATFHFGQRGDSAPQPAPSPPRPFSGTGPTAADPMPPPPMHPGGALNLRL